MAGGWFETVAVAQRRAKRRVPSSVYKAIIGGAEKGVSLDANQGVLRPSSGSPRTSPASTPSARWPPG